MIKVGYQTACGQKVEWRQKPKPCGEDLSSVRREGIHHVAGQLVQSSSLQPSYGAYVCVCTRVMLRRNQIIKGLECQATV